MLVACLAIGCARPPAQQTIAPERSAQPRAAATAATAATPAASSLPPSVDFARDLRPIFERRCEPCHFPGGKMYERLPFDRAATIQTLGERLFTRIKAEDEQALIRRFLAQGPPR